LLGPVAPAGRGSSSAPQKLSINADNSGFGTTTR
jgi:hypothetical protein